MTVRRVFGEAYQLDGVDVIPVASIRGGGGAGGADGGTTSDANDQGVGPAGAGLGFGVDARPVGVLVVKDGDVTWCPTVDVTRIVLNGQQIALSAMVALSAMLIWRNVRHRHHFHR